MLTRGTRGTRGRGRTPGLGPRYRRLFGAHVVSNLGDGVGTIAYPWLASAVTRNPLLIAGVTIAQRLPWLVVSLPAGVVTDRVDRKRLMVACDAARAAVTALLALAVAVAAGLPAPDAVDGVVGTHVPLYLAVIVATLALGVAEVLRDSTAQTLMPAIVPAEALETANGRLWSAESVANTFVGPPLGSLVLVVSFALPIGLDALSFAVAAVLVWTIPGSYRAAPPPTGTPARAPWHVELRTGLSWLWHQPLLRTMAIVLGLMNAAMAGPWAVFVLFAQEVLGIRAGLVAVVGMGGAVGGIVGGWFAARLSRRFGAGGCLTGVLVLEVLTAGLIGLVTSWPVTLVLLAAEGAGAIVWNVITVSLRQQVIPDHLFGRVNAAYRFFAWGMMPIGAAAGGAVVVAVDAVASRDLALRSVFFVAAVVQLALAVVVRRSLTTARIETLRASAAR
jgi:MFS family permease